MFLRKKAIAVITVVFVLVLTSFTFAKERQGEVTIEADGKMLNEDLFGFNIGYKITFKEL